MRSSQPAGPDSLTRAFSHEAFFYDDTEQYVRSLAAFLRQGIAADEPALVVVDPEQIAGLRSALGDDADAVGFADMRRIGGNPARIIPVWQDFVTRSGLQRPLRGIGEPIWPGRSDDELPECHQHEALLNLAFGNVPMRLVCPYSTRDLPDSVLHEAMHTHPRVLEGDQVLGSSEYRLLTSDEVLDGRLPEHPVHISEMTVGLDDLAEMRNAVADQARLAGLSPDRAEDMTIAVNELATNSLVHGSGKAEVRSWIDGPSLVIEVHDEGVITDPLVGRRFPSAATSDGRGLWLVNQLCDLVQMRSTAAGTIIRVHMRRSGPRMD